MKLNKVLKLREIIENQSSGLEDEVALTVPELFPKWKPGKQYSAGERLQHDGILYRVLQAHTSQADWTPDTAVSLFAQVLPGQDGTDIGEWVQPDSTNPYMAGDKVTHNGHTWESTVDNNVWEPGVYGWVEVVE